jgi:hypothetical protein
VQGLTSALDFCFYLIAVPCSQVFYVFNSCCLLTASNNGYSSASMVNVSLLLYKFGTYRIETIVSMVPLFLVHSLPWKRVNCAVG